MKTAQELAEELILALDHSDLTQRDIETFLRIHLLDAWKQGMTDAANAVSGLKWSQEKAREHLINLRDSMKSL